ncbi:hypothetical protein H6G03_22925, partial [Planktothrix sp. FACHB-1375]|nr:hypothetical protein [Aerosakkonema funiforme FACHB-1375]
VKSYNTFVLSWGSDRTPASALTKVHTVSITFVRLLILISLIAIGSIWVFLAMAILFFLFKKIQMRIDAWKISMTNDLLGFTWKHSRPSKREDISELVFFRQGSSEYFEVREEVGLRPLLIIQAGKQQYRLSKVDSLTEEEIYWLAQELSDWLKLPIIEE